MRFICLISLLMTQGIVYAGTDPVADRAMHDLSIFSDWLCVNHAEGYVGEVGWPAGGGWDELAEKWFAEADQERLWVTVWATGEWWNEYSLSVYRCQRSDVLNAANPQARVLEAHLSVAGALRGVNVCGPEFGVREDGGYSNHAPGVASKDYRYPAAESLRFLAGRGIKLIRLPIRWERLQPRLHETLDPAELLRLSRAVDDATAAGLDVVVDLHNFGEYWLFDGCKGVRRTIGSPEVPIAAFGDLWRRVSEQFKDNPRVFYGLMNEPHDFPEDGDAGGAWTWEQASQAAVLAIRSTGDRKKILVPGYNWAGVRTWRVTHPQSWIHDPASNFRYEAHHYWDADASGTYRLTYPQELDALKAGDSDTVHRP